MPRMLSDELKSGNWKQGNGCLYDGGGYCCLGVMEKAAGVEFHYEDDGWFDAFDAYEMPIGMVADITGINHSLSADQRRMLEEETDVELSDPTIMNILAALNDAGIPFDEIAQYLVEYDMDVDIDDLQYALIDADWS